MHRHHQFKTMNKQNKNLDQFFTKDEVVSKCLDSLRTVLNGYTQFPYEVMCRPMSIVEPSAGDGAFFLPLKKEFKGERFVVEGYDLDPRCEGVVKADFLTAGVEADIFVGNPPFGNRSSLAIDFVNEAAKSAYVLAFIVPVQFRKWSVQNKIDNDFSLVTDELLPEDAFRVDGKPYKVRCCFQVWVRRGYTTAQDIRIAQAPDISHPDFDMFQYNNTPQALKIFDNSFDFAVPRQGYQDYNRKEIDATKCEKNKQWLLFKARNKTTLNKLKSLDFEKLAKRNTTTPGFGKADVVALYKGEL